MESFFRFFRNILFIQGCCEFETTREIKPGNTKFLKSRKNANCCIQLCLRCDKFKIEATPKTSVHIFFRAKPLPSPETIQSVSSKPRPPQLTKMLWGKVKSDPAKGGAQMTNRRARLGGREKKDWSLRSTSLHSTFLIFEAVDTTAT